MAATESSSGGIKRQELDDMTTCCICTEVFTDPKALPCIHTFCMKCLRETGVKTNKGPGDEMPCPICRRLFKIPSEGFCGLPKNFFIERLIQVSKVSDPSALTKALCSVCLEESKEQKGKEIPTADTYCVECKHKLCEECCSEHRKFKLTKNHKLMPIDEYESGQNVVVDLAPMVCEFHEQKVLDVYCADCKTVVCAICFIEDHNGHKGGHVSKCVDGFRKQIQNSTEAMNGCIAESQMKKAELVKVKEEMQKMVETLECDVEKRKDYIKQLTDKHASSLLQGLCYERQSRLKEIQMATDAIDDYLSNLECYNFYCQRLIEKGSVSDICRTVSDLSIRAFELEQQCQPTNETRIPDFRFCFRQSELEEFLEEYRDNLVGEIEEEGDSKPKKRSKQSLLVEKTNENDLLRKEIEIERTEKESLRLANEQLRIKAAKEVEAKMTLTAELNMYKATVTTLETNAKELRKELKTTKTDKSDPVLVQTIRTKAVETGKKALLGLTILDKELFVVSDSSEVEVYDSIQLSFSRRWNLKKLIYPLDIGSCNRNKCLYIMDYKGSFQSKEILRVDANGKLIKSWSTGENWGRLSVTDESNVILTVYDNNKLNEYSPDGQLIREINLSSEAGIRGPWHAIKLTNGYFVVSHGDGDDELHRVCIVGVDGKLKKSFGGKRGSAVGQLDHPLYLSVDGNGFVMVADKFNHRIFLLDQDLELKRETLSKDGKHGLRNPTRILLDESNGRLFVAENDPDNRRILIFDLNN